MERRKRSIDMLSGLPDEILRHILSFLPTKTSVCTSVLAKRWRFLWTHVPNLNFSGYNFRGKKNKHFDIISRVIMQHESKIVNTFKLSNVKVCAYQLETLLIYPIKRSVRNLYLHFDFKYKGDIACTVPRLLLTCKTLVNLKLVNCGVIPSTGELFLPSLKKLNLSYVVYESDESLPLLLSGCPVLEELIVNDCFREEQKNSGCVIVSSPTIQTLTVDFSNGDEFHSDEMLIIDVPALIYLKVNRCDLECVKSLRKTMTSLIEVDITLNGDWHYCEIDCTQHGRSIEFLSCLCHVKYLKIKSEFQEILVDIARTGSMPKFVNLTKLKLDLTVIWYDLVKFLEVADNLEVLNILVDVTPSYKEPERVPACMLSRLRTVKMYHFCACQDAFEMVRYILRNAQVLERMKIDPGSIPEYAFDEFWRISLFERGSKSCQLQLDPQHRLLNSRRHYQ